MITAVAMGTVVLTPASQVVAASCVWTVTFTLGVGVSSGGYIDLSTPVWNSGLGANSNEYYCNGSVSCAGITSKK